VPRCRGLLLSRRNGPSGSTDGGTNITFRCVGQNVAYISLRGAGCGELLAGRQGHNVRKYFHAVHLATLPGPNSKSTYLPGNTLGKLSLIYALAVYLKCWIAFEPFFEIPHRRMLCVHPFTHIATSLVRQNTSSAAATIKRSIRT
jgi:hypothetical protein